ncbi:hypothetical protein CONPUDRAFT_73051 [Coniophora puteana RWD-64-598 SS2]|uniref:Uncharacterized protein n=1 Tax=Coniophora puteana (strain RWD-64-598) TaxID=741705 RepID=A0A5M3MQD8_CONPW|nr:uncharacterized protein CONPUDRAFT_73051 [Coniophora puteana RWD-64-598 SS2]EIW81277.1 hypothetical protein CONPUDRAFT_73051 [Coniophora puteana RWD-64-598 SS2]
MPRAPEKASCKCSCIFYGCGSSPTGWKPQKPRTFRQHQEQDDLQRALEATQRGGEQRGEPSSKRPSLSEFGDDIQEDAHLDERAAGSGRDAVTRSEADEFQNQRELEHDQDIEMVETHEDVQIRVMAMQEDALVEQRSLFDGHHHPTLDNLDNGNMSDDDYFFTRLRHAFTPPPPEEIGEQEEEEVVVEEAVLEPEDEQPVLDEILHVPLGDVFNFSDVHEQDYYHDQLPQAFEDHSIIRNVYIRVFVLVVVHGVSHSAAQCTLDGLRLTITQAANKHPEDDYPGLSNFARMVPTVLKRLGLSMDHFIIYLTVCDVCWAVHHPSTISDLPSPSCTSKNCTGTIYKEKRLANGDIKRTPVKIVPYVPLERAIQRFLLRPGKWEQLQHWRGRGDEAGPVPPNYESGFDAFANPSKPMTDIYDGWGWRAIQAEGRRIRHSRCRRSRTQPEFNIDWFQSTTRDCHSTGAFYVVICNNPRSIRYAAEETILAMVLPGPHEPNLQQLNNLMDVFVNSAMRLGQGVEFKVYDHNELELVHTHLSMNCSNLPSSRRTNGYQGHASKLFMCPQCCATYFSLVHPSCFDPTQFEPREDWRHIKYAFRARDANEHNAQVIREHRGVSWTPLNYLPGWMPAGSAGIDFMHCVFLTMVKHVTKVIIHGHGLLNSTQETDPIQLLEKFYHDLHWPPEMSYGKGSVKADQWRNLIHVLFVGLFVAWEQHGEIPDANAPPSAANTKIAKAQAKYTTATRTCLREFTLAQNPLTPPEVLDQLSNFTVAIRILATREISPMDVKRGSAALARATQTWVSMHLPLTPYFHFGQHLEEQIYKHGPIYGHWTFPYKQLNGKLL